MSGNIQYPTPATPPDQGCWGVSKKMIFGEIALPATWVLGVRAGSKENISLVLVVLLPRQLEESGAFI